MNQEGLAGCVSELGMGSLSQGDMGPRVALCVDRGFRYVIVGDKKYTLDQLCLHGVLSPNDVSHLQAVMHYVCKAVALVEGV